MTKIKTHPEPTGADTLGRACDMFLEWDRSVYGTMNVAEGMILSDLFASLGPPGRRAPRPQCVGGRG